MILASHLKSNGVISRIYSRRPESRPACCDRSFVEARPSGLLPGAVPRVRHSLEGSNGLFICPRVRKRPPDVSPIRAMPRSSNTGVPVEDMGSPARRDAESSPPCSRGLRRRCTCTRSSPMILRHQRRWPNATNRAGELLSECRCYRILHSGQSSPANSGRRTTRRGPRQLWPYHRLRKNRHPLGRGRTNRSTGSLAPRKGSGATNLPGQQAPHNVPSNEPVVLC